MKTQLKLAMLGGAALLMLSFAACGGGDDDASSTGSGDDSPAATEAATGGEPASGEPITITMTDNSFDAADLTIPVNTTVQITVNNEGQSPHNMHVLAKDGGEAKDFSSDSLVSAGGTSTFEVTFTEEGEFTFQCDFHLPDMVGTITVQ